MFRRFSVHGCNDPLYDRRCVCGAVSTPADAFQDAAAVLLRDEAVRMRGGPSAAELARGRGCG